MESKITLTIKGSQCHTMYDPVTRMLSISFIPANGVGGNTVFEIHKNEAADVVVEMLRSIEFDEYDWERIVEASS